LICQDVNEVNSDASKEEEYGTRIVSYFYRFLGAGGVVSMEQAYELIH